MNRVIVAIGIFVFVLVTLPLVIILCLNTLGAGIEYGFSTYLASFGLMLLFGNVTLRISRDE